MHVAMLWGTYKSWRPSPGLKLARMLGLDLQWQIQGPPFPQDFFKIMQFSGNFKGKPPISSKFWAQGPPGVKTPLDPLTKILDPRLCSVCSVSVRRRRYLFPTPDESLLFAEYTLPWYLLATTADQSWQSDRTNITVYLYVQESFLQLTARFIFLSSCLLEPEGKPMER